MITPMKKYSFLLYHKDYKQFLEDLQELGVVHIIEKKEEVDEATREKLQFISQINKTLTFLKRREQDEKAEKTGPDAAELVENVQHMREEISNIEQEKISLEKDIQKAFPWGDVTPEMYDRFNKLNLRIRLFTCPEKKYDEAWEDEYYMQIVNNYEGNIYFVVFQEEGQEINIDTEEVRLPDKPLSVLQKELQNYEERLETIESTFDEYAIKYQQILRDAHEKLQEQTSFEYALNNTEEKAESRLKILEGWAPETKVDELEQFLEKQDVLFLSSMPDRKEKVPILLNNNKFTKVFEPIGDLFDLPNYKELDLTPFFAPFFMLFFGFCVGDTGYGLLILIGTLILRSKVKPKLKPIMTMASYLGVATIIMGLVSGTFFGVNLTEVEAMPGKDLILKPIEMFYLSIGLGIVQIIFGMFIKAANQIKQYGFKYGISTMGWILLILSAAIFIGAPKAGLFEVTGTLDIISKGFYILSGAMILLFSDPSKNIFASIGIGIYDVYNMITGVFGDMLSYIRLFALGISSAILGLVFNQIASQFLGMSYVGWLFFVIVLIIGHGLNIFLAALGAFVHPLRLTFVEFYKNAGFTGGGKQYKPFSK